MCVYRVHTTRISSKPTEILRTHKSYFIYHHCSDVSLILSNIFFIAALRHFISSKMAVNLGTLPVELQHKIVGIVNSTTDLHSLCLVSKQISTVSTTHLYRNFYFPFMTPDAAERLCITLANSSGLLPLVKTFRLGMCLRFCSERLESAFLRLLSAFPDDCLCKFQLDGHTLRPAHQDFLWCHQQKIHGLELVIVSEEIWQRRRINKNSLPDSGMIHELEKLEKLGLAKRLGPEPNSLRIHGSASSKHWESGIISHRRLPLTNMKELSLDDVIVKGLSLDSLPHLTHLAFRDCSAAGKCLSAFRVPRLKALFFFYDPYERNVLLNLSNFLLSFQGLETLSVRDIWKYRPSAAEQLGTLLLGTAIGAHKETLGFLSVHFNHQVYRNPRHFDPIVDAATECLKLTQLGLSLSPRRLHLLCVRILNLLPSLVTLRIDMEHSLSYLALWHLAPINESPAYTKVIGRIADKAMEAAASKLSPSKFALLSVGYVVKTNLHFVGPVKRGRALDGGPDNLGTCECRHGFAHSDAFVFRRNGREALRISPGQAKILIPESDIINFRERFFNCE